MLSRNPILPGCYPDPSICRAGDDYFLVTSTFALYPGIPVHRSTDLVDWELIGHVLVDESWIDLDDLDPSDGVWAPTVRHHDGVFYVVFAMARGRTGAETYLCTATDPRGPWSTRIVDGADGIDPSLFFDDDGRCWFTAARDAPDPAATGPAEIWLRELDLQTLRLIGPESVLWHGAIRGQWTEAPHLYKRDGVYTLVCAEGGTERNHAVTAAQATHVRGPYRTDPRSPLLTHRHLGPGVEVHNVGHADIVDAPDGSSWAVVLGVRPVDGHHVLGRETFLTPVSWSAEGPVFAPGDGMIRVAGHDGAGGVEARTEWLSLRGPIEAEVHGDRVVLKPGGSPSSRRGRPALLAQRQLAHDFAFEATVRADAVVSSEPGVVAFQNPLHWAGVRLRSGPRGVVAVAALTSGGVETVLAEREVSGEVGLWVRGSRTAYVLGVVEDGIRSPLASIPHSALSTESAGGFVGVLVGVGNAGDPTGEPTVFQAVEHRLGVGKPAAAVLL